MPAYGTLSAANAYHLERGNALTQREKRGAMGVYAIRNLVNGKVYVGSSVYVRERLSTHKREMRDGSHKNKRLVAAWAKYGEQAFEFIQLEAVADRATLIEREQFWMDELGSFGRHGYNILPSAGSRAGCTMPASAIEKVRKASLGRKHSDESRKLMSERLRGKIRTPEMKARTREITKRVASEMSFEQRQAISLKSAATHASRKAAMNENEREALFARRSDAAKRSAATKRERGHVISIETLRKQEAARHNRGADERRAIALRAWETKRAKKLEAANG